MLLIVEYRGRQQVESYRFQFWSCNFKNHTKEKIAHLTTQQISQDLPFSLLLSVSWLSLGHALPPLQGHYTVITPAWGPTCDAIVVSAHLVACNAPMKSVMIQVGSPATFLPIAYLLASTCAALYWSQIYAHFTFWELALTLSDVQWLGKWTNSVLPKNQIKFSGVGRAGLK